MNILNFCKNYFSTLLFIFIAYTLYSNIPFYSNFIDQSVSLNSLQYELYIPLVFYWIIICYIIFLIPLYIVYPYKSKARVVIEYFLKVLQGDNSYTDTDKTALLAWCVKLFFVPLMVTWLTTHIFTMINRWIYLSHNTELITNDFLLFFNQNFFWTAFSTILFVDVLFFTLGYLIEIPKLKNTIRSVEPTIIGWLAVLLCYPPVNNLTNNFISWYSTDFPQFINPSLQVGLNLTILVLMGVYAWASLSLGFKASNLTNRGIVTKGPYKYVRHPAYICKNTAWIIGGIPMLIVAWNSQDVSTFSIFLGLFGWAFIYYLRAITEENHLSADPEYLEYKKQVTYKFIPKIW